MSGMDKKTTHTLQQSEKRKLAFEDQKEKEAKRMKAESDQQKKANEEFFADSNSQSKENDQREDPDWDQDILSSSTNNPQLFPPPQDWPGL